MSTFWNDHSHAARVLLAAAFVPQVLVQIGLGLDAGHEKTLLQSFSDNDPQTIDYFEDLLDDQDVWIEHIDWFFSGGIRAHAPRPKVTVVGDAGAPSTPPAGPTP